MIQDSQAGELREPSHIAYLSVSYYPFRMCGTRTA